MALVVNEDLVIPWTLGNRDPLSAILRDQNKDPIDLTGKTIVCRWINQRTGTTKVNDQPCVVDADQVANTGRVTYSPAASDVDTVGLYVVYFFDDTASPSIRFPYDGPKLKLHIIPEI